MKTYEVTNKDKALEFFTDCEKSKDIQLEIVIPVPNIFGKTIVGTTSYAYGSGIDIKFKFDDKSSLPILDVHLDSGKKYQIHEDTNIHRWDDEIKIKKRKNGGGLNPNEATDWLVSHFFGDNISSQVISLKSSYTVNHTQENNYLISSTEESVTDEITNKFISDNQDEMVIYGRFENPYDTSYEFENKKV